MTLVYFWPQIVGGRVLYWGDIGLYFTPMSAFLRENLRAGWFPLWNSLIYCGTPYAGNPQTWPLYPVTALLPFVSAPYFFNLTIALHVWLAGCGTYLFARRTLNVGRMAAILAAVTFMFGGQFVSKEQFPNMVQSAAWLPWVLWALDRLLHRRRIQDALALGLILGLQLLAAHAQMTVLTLYLAAAWGIFVLAPPTPNNRGVRGKGWQTSGKSLFPSLFRGGWRGTSREGFLLPHYWGRGGLLLLALFVAAGLSAGQLLPTLALFRDAARQRLTFTVVNRFYLPWNEIGNFVLPCLHGHPFYSNWSARGNFWETCCYVGWVSFGLAVWGGVSAWCKGGAKAGRFWTIVFMFGVWMALGGSGGLYRVAYFALPAFRAFHDPARCLLWASFALSMLAASGWEKMAPPAPNKGRAGMNLEKTNSPLIFPHCWGRGALILLAFADLAHFGRTLYPLADSAALFPITPNIAAVQADSDIQAHQARILVPTAGVWLRFTSLRSFEQDVPEYQSLWADTLTPNLTMPYGLRDAFGYEPVALKNAQKVDDKAAHAFDPRASQEDQHNADSLAGVLGVKYIVVCRVAPPEKTLSGLVSLRAAPTLAPPGRKRGPQAKIYLSQNAKWQPRARMEALSNPVTLTEDGPDQITLTCTTTAPDRLILADTQAAGWQATVDGQPSPIETYDGSLRAVEIRGKGAHRVVFSYQPTPYRLGLYLSLLTLSGLIGAGFLAVARNLAHRAGFGERGVE